MMTFDLISDLSWGESFSCLFDRKLHEWIPAILGSVRFLLLINIVRNYGLDFLAPHFVPKEVQASRAKNYRLAQEKVQKRIEHGAARGDFWDRILIKSANDNASGEGMSEGEMLNNATVLVLAGSETSATTLSGVTYLLLKHPETMRKVVAELRSSFMSDAEINLFSVGKLKYQFAVLEETMRIYPPVLLTGPRVPPRGGAVVCGKFVPEGTTVNISILGANRATCNWHRPDDFVPERWLDHAPAEYASDDKGAFQPFSIGTRNCIGRNLAYAEMRLVLAKLLWHFDIALDEERTDDWFDQKEWGLWHKRPLYVKLTRARR